MKKKIPYLNKDFHRSSDSLTRMKWYSVLVDTGHTKMYHAASGALIGLSQSARAVLDFACAHMSPENLIENNGIFKEELNRRMLRFKKKSTPPTL